VIWPQGSDSASLDNALELFVASGRDPVHAVMMMIPQAWEKYADVDPSVRAFYEYHSCLHEPWDGPAALAYTDGRIAGAAVDRNGLRPCRYKIRRDGLVFAGSEVGLVDFEPEDVIESGKVGPGEVLLADLERGIIVRNLDAKRAVAGRQPYESWVRRYMAVLSPTPFAPCPLPPATSWCAPATVRLRIRGPPHHPRGDGHDGRRSRLEHGRRHAHRPARADAAGHLQLFPAAFRAGHQSAIDPLREAMVMSLRMHVGRRGSPLIERPNAAQMLRVEHPILLASEMAGLLNVRGFPTEIIDAVMSPELGPDGLKAALRSLQEQAVRAVRAGARILVVSDRAAGPTRAPIPMLLAIGAVRQELVRTGLRARVGLVAETGDAFDIHHFATLIGYGAEAVHPWLALASVESIFSEASAAEAREGRRAAASRARRGR
jgi:hypothetical protein